VLAKYNFDPDTNPLTLTCDAVKAVDNVKEPVMKELPFLWPVPLNVISPPKLPVLYTRPLALFNTKTLVPVEGAVSVPGI